MPFRSSTAVGPRLGDRAAQNQSAGHPPWHLFSVLVLCLAFSSLYVVFVLVQHDHFRTSYDSVIFDQAVRAYSHLRPPTAPIKGVHDYGRANFDLLGDHFSPVMALLAPLYLLWPNVEMLLVAQGVLFAVSIPVVWVFTRRALGTPPAYLVAAAYGLSWGLQSALGFDVHEIMFGVPVVALMIERLQANRPNQAIAIGSVLIFIKEDLSLMFAALGVLLILRGWHRRGLATLAGGLLAFVLITQVVIPHFAVGHRYGYFGETAFHGGLFSALGYLFRHPLATLQRLVLPAAKWQTLLWLTAPWLFTALLSPLSLLAVPELVVRFLGTDPHWWGTSYQYSAVLMPVMAMAAVDGLARLIRWTSNRSARVAPSRRPVTVLGGAGWAGGVFLVAVWACTQFPFQALGATAEWRMSPADVVLDAAVARIPSHTVVEAPASVAPHLTDKDTVLLLDQVPRHAPWVIVDTNVVEFPFTDRAQELGRPGVLERQGYLVVFHRAGVIVLHEP